MTFSQNIKAELAEVTGREDHCRRAELAALVGSCGSYSVRWDRKVFLSAQSENLLAAGKTARLMNRLFRVRPEVSVLGQGDGRRSRLYTVAVTDGEEAERILSGLGFLSEQGALRELTLPAAPSLLERPCCRRAYLRGCFLASGSLSDPRKSYHLEIVTASQERAEQIRDTIACFDVEAKIAPRRNFRVVYVNDGDGIADMLNIMGARLGLMDLENIRIYRGISGEVNRSVNCETANLNRTVTASVEQVRDIEKIRDTIGLERLPAPLREMARVRLEYPDLPLRDLGEHLNPPVGKSGVNHRLRKLRAIASEL